MKLRRMKSSMTQWINLLQNNRSIFRTVFAFVVPKTGPIHLVLVGLTAGQQAGRPADESLVELSDWFRSPTLEMMCWLDVLCWTVEITLLFQSWNWINWKKRFSAVSWILAGFREVWSNMDSFLPFYWPMLQTAAKPRSVKAIPLFNKLLILITQGMHTRWVYYCKYILCFYTLYALLVRFGLTYYSMTSKCFSPLFESFAIIILTSTVFQTWVLQLC